MYGKYSFDKDMESTVLCQLDKAYERKRYALRRNFFLEIAVVIKNKGANGGADNMSLGF